MIVSLVKGSAVPHVAILEVDAQHLALLNHYIFYLFFKKNENFDVKITKEVTVKRSVFPIPLR